MGPRFIKIDHQIRIPQTPVHVKKDLSTSPLPDLIEESLGRARKENALYMNRIRFGVASACVALFLFGASTLNLESFRETAWLMILYWIGSGLLWMGSRRSGKILTASRFAVPLLDMPFATLIQWLRLGFQDADGATAVFSLSVFLFLVMLSTFSMRVRQTILCAAEGTVLYWILANAAELSAISLVSAPIMLIMTAWMASALPLRQSRLIREAAEKQARRDRLALYFSPGVAEVIEARDELGEGESCELSVLFCDIRGFTRLSEPMEARDVVKLLNDFHGRMVDAIFRHGGTLDKYLGDGLLAYFNAPVPQRDHAERSVRCALAMVTELDLLNREREARGEAVIGMGIGIHAGHAVVGNVGAAHRREFTAIGDTVNVASRLQHMTREHEGADILVSEAVVDQCAGSGNLQFQPIADVEVRGRDQRLRIFAPILISPDPEITQSGADS